MQIVQHGMTVMMLPQKENYIWSLIVTVSS